MSMTPEEEAAAQAESQGDEGRKPEEWHRFREQEKKTKKAEAEAAAAKRQLAFRDAGINPADKDAPPHTQMFVDSYKGELDVKSITAEAVKMNILKADTPTDPATKEPQAQAATAAKNIDAASAGATPEGGGTSVDRIDEAYEQGGTAAVAAELKSQGIPTIHSP